nr:unnamed protein product [Callosobruchus analis]
MTESNQLLNFLGKPSDMAVSGTFAMGAFPGPHGSIFDGKPTHPVGCDPLDPHCPQKPHGSSPHLIPGLHDMFPYHGHSHHEKPAHDFLPPLEGCSPFNPHCSSKHTPIPVHTTTIEDVKPTVVTIPAKPNIRPVVEVVQEEAPKKCEYPVGTKEEDKAEECRTKVDVSGSGVSFGTFSGSTISSADAKTNTKTTQAPVATERPNVIVEKTDGVYGGRKEAHHDPKLPEPEHENPKLPEKQHHEPQHEKPEPAQHHMLEHHEPDHKEHADHVPHHKPDHHLFDHHFPEHPKSDHHMHEHHDKLHHDYPTIEQQVPGKPSCKGGSSCEADITASVTSSASVAGSVGAADHHENSQHGTNVVDISTSGESKHDKPACNGGTCETDVGSSIASVGSLDESEHHHKPACAGGSCGLNGSSAVTTVSTVSGSSFGSYGHTPGCKGGNCGAGSVGHKPTCIDKGFATGSVTIHKDDGLVTTIGDGPNGGQGCFGGNCGSSGSGSGAVGFGSTGSTAGDGSYSGGGATAGGGSYGGNGAGGHGADKGFATGSVTIHKNDGSVSTIGDGPNGGHGCFGGNCGSSGSGSGAVGFGGTVINC